jgi:hypothetical protein
VFAPDGDFNQESRSPAGAKAHLDLLGGRQAPQDCDGQIIKRLDVV